MEQSKTPNNSFDFKEVYQQRYETYRHLDRLRWQMMQIGVTAASVIFAFSSEKESTLEVWTWLGVGIVLIFSATAMLKISNGISANAKMLKIAGEHLGDSHLLESPRRRGSVAFWIAITMLSAGVMATFYPLITKACL